MRLRGKLSRILAVGLVALAAGAWQPPRNPGLPSAAEINGILRELSDITGFAIHRELPFASVTRDQVNGYLKEQIRETVKPQEIQAEEVSLKMLGFVPDDFDLKQTTIDLLTEQAAAFYDFHRRKLFISDWATVNMRDEALIHELAHALADQNFPIRKFMESHSDDSEISLAREAVVEGQASWLMLEVTARRNGKTLADPETARQLLELDTASADNEYPVFGKAPLYLRRTLLFPYDAGQRFQQAVFERDGKAGFTRVFRDPPVSSAQIDFPERYFAHEDPKPPTLPKLAKGAREFVAGTLGELETHILLEQYVNEAFADTLSPHLKGGVYRIEEDPKTHRRTLLYISEWDNEDSASRFFAAYQDVLRGKSKAIDVASRTDDDITGKTERGYFSVTRTAKQVVVREGYAA
ncbi:MAG TPA: hypothetical protein VEF06_15460, partial [Bryobacteraceae bacterium]|nr:hypothetical protein [Bryobacteraceae bacterium]